MLTDALAVIVFVMELLGPTGEQRSESRESRAKNQESRIHEINKPKEKRERERERERERNRNRNNEK